MSEGCHTALCSSPSVGGQEVRCGGLDMQLHEIYIICVTLHE